METEEATSGVDPEGQATLLVERVQGAQGLVRVEWRLSADAAEDFLPPLQGTLSFKEVCIITVIICQKWQGQVAMYKNLYKCVARN